MTENDQQANLINAAPDDELRQIHNIPQRQNENASLIQALKQTPNFLQQKYNEKIKKENPTRPVRAGGVYVPPHKLRALQEELMQREAGGMEHQRMMWELLRKSINGIVNKVNISNIQNIVIELFNQNILRGKGLLSKSLIKAQMASPNFTHVYSALIAVINTKLPEIGNLILKRVMYQFRRAFERNNKIVCMSTTKMVAHLLNQRVLGQYAGLQLLFILLNQPTQASVQIACDFMIEAGQVLSQLTPAGANAIFERFKTLLHEAQISQKAQYSIQNLFAIRKTGFKEHPGVMPELDLVEPQDQITHNMDFQDQLTTQQNLNIFKLDPFYQKNEQQWDLIKLQILGEQNIINLKKVHNYEQQMLEQQQRMQQQQKQQQIHDLTEQDLVNLRRTIYLIIQSTLNFEQCAHKLLKMNIAKGYEHELVDMIIECCMMERIYQNFFGLLAERFCIIDDLYKELFIKAFINHYNTIFKLEVNKVRNLAKLFGHLLFRFAIDWTVFQVIVLKPETTTAAGRMFLKILFKEIAQNLGIQKTKEQFSKEDMRQYFEGLFPIDHPNNLRFSINYFTSIGLGPLTEGMRQILGMQEEIIMSRKLKEEQEKIMQQIKEEEEMLRIMEEEENKERQKMEAQNQLREERMMENQKLLKQQRRKDDSRERPRRREEETRRSRLQQTTQRRNAKRKESSSSSSSSSGSSSSSSSSSSSQDSREKMRSRNNKQQDNKKTSKPEEKRPAPKKRQASSSRSQRKVQETKKQRSGKQRERSRQNVKQDKNQIKRKRSKSSSSRSSSSNSQPVRKNKANEKQQNVKVEKKESPLKKIKNQQPTVNKKTIQSKQQSQSSGISSSDSSSSDESGEISQESSKGKKKIATKIAKKQKKKRVSESSSSSSSDSSSSVDTNELYRRKLKKDGKA